MLPRARWLDLGWALFTNLFVLAGVLAWGWPPGNVLVLFWVENVILGVVTAVRIATAQGGLQPGAPTGSRVAKVLFFTVHYGIFALVHGVFAGIIAFSIGMQVGFWSLAVPALLIALRYVVDLATTWFIGEQRRTNPALSPMMGLTHGVHGVGETVAVSVHTVDGVINVDEYLARRPGRRTLRLRRRGGGARGPSPVQDLDDDRLRPMDAAVLPQRDGADGEFPGLDWDERVVVLGAHHGPEVHYLDRGLSARVDQLEAVQGWKLGFTPLPRAGDAHAENQPVVEGDDVPVHRGGEIRPRAGDGPSGDCTRPQDRLDPLANGQPAPAGMDEARKHTTMSDDATYNVAADELRQFIEQIEGLEAEKKDLTEQIREIYAEAKARGYDAKAMRSIVSLRKRDKDDIAEQEALIELYKSALGMG